MKLTRADVQYWLDSTGNSIADVDLIASKRDDDIGTIARYVSNVYYHNQDKRPKLDRDYNVVTKEAMYTMLKVQTPITVTMYQMVTYFKKIIKEIQA